jgi:serine/threonine-protein phosphatase 2A regulatory subunit A
MFATLVEDEMPMVRRATAANLGAFAASVSMDVVKSDLIPLWVRLMGDDQDNVRPLAVEAAIQFAKILSKEDNLAFVVQPLHAASKDRSWRVRYTLANKYAELEAELGTEIAKTEMTPMLVRLLQDQEKEVRMAAALKIPSICAGLSNAERRTIIVTNVVQHVQSLCTDASQHVRVSISASLLELGPILGKEKSVEILVPLFVALLKDDYFDVRLNIISKLNILQDVVGKEAVQSQILTEVVLLADDPQWRVRLAICEQMPMLAKSLGADGFDSAKLSLSAVCLNWLLDNVFAVRECATRTVAAVCDVFGDAWSKTKIFPRITAMASEKAYLSRLTTLIAVKVMCENASADSATSVLLPIVAKLAKDTIPNVRFNAAQALKYLVTKVAKKTVTGEVVPLLKEMTADSDMDVKFYASSALAVC